MLKCKITKRKKCRTRVSGTTREIVKETAILIHSVYLSIRKANPELAGAFKHELLMLLAPDSPVWKSYEGEDTSHEN